MDMLLPVCPCCPAHAHRCYTALYKTLCRQMAAVKQSCDAYQRFVSNVHVKVDHLKLGEDQPALSYIEEWFQEQQEVRNSSALACTAAAACNVLARTVCVCRLRPAQHRWLAAAATVKVSASSHLRACAAACRKHISV